MNPDVFDEAEDGLRLDELAAMTLFAGADLSSVLERLKGCPVKRLFEGELLIAPGLGSRALYLVLNGGLRVHLDALEMRPVRLLGVGEAIGGSSLAEGRPTYVVADTRSSVLAIDHETFWSLVYAEHAVALNMLKAILDGADAASMPSRERATRPGRHRLQTHVDGLTGLPDRTALLDLLRRQMLRSSMGAKPLSVLIVAIDELVSSISELGEIGSEEILWAVAAIIRAQVRPTDIVGRLDDAHRFVVVLPDCDEQAARCVAKRLSEEVSHVVVMMPDQSLPPVTILSGVAEMREHARAEELLEAAGRELPGA